MNSLWKEIIGTRAFWLACVSAGVDFAGSRTLLANESMLSEGPGCGALLSFDFPTGHVLQLEVHSGEHDLHLLSPDLDKRVEVARMDCHQMSDLLRWDEFVAVTSRLAPRSQPAWAIELLFSFYVAVTIDCAEEHSALLRRCLQQSRVFAVPEVEHIVFYSQRVALRKDFRWTREFGWIAEGQNAYSLRRPGSPFNFELFQAFLSGLGVSS